MYRLLSGSRYVVFILFPILTEIFRVFHIFTEISHIRMLRNHGAETAALVFCQRLTRKDGKRPAHRIMQHTSLSHFLISHYEARCAVLAMMASCTDLSSSVKYAMYPATRTRIFR